MEIKLEKGLLDRLVCAKYLFKKGQERLFSNSYYSEGEAVLLFQDSVEMTLRVIAEHLGCSLKPNAGFDALIVKINSMGRSKVPYSSSLAQMNKSRVGFKHHGLSPRKNDVLKFSSDLDSFYPQAFEDFLDVDFNTVSLVDLVLYARTRNHLKAAEEYHAEQNYRESVFSSAKAFQLFRYNIDSRKVIFPRKLYGHFLGQDPKAAQWKLEVETAIDKHQSLLDLVLMGIDMVEYQKYYSITPNVAMTISGSFQVLPRGLQTMPEHGIEESLFCMNFVLESVMRVEQNRPISFNSRNYEKHEYEIINSTPIIVYPKDDPEVICTLNSGDTVCSNSKEIPLNKDYMKIRFQGDFAYVKNSDLKEIK